MEWKIIRPCAWTLGSFRIKTLRPWDKYFDPDKPFDSNKYEKAMLAKGYAIARTRRNADGFAGGDYSAILDDGTVWPDLNINMVPELLLDEVRLVNNFLKDRLGRKPTRNFWYGHSAGAYTGLALNYMIQSNPDINKDADGKETISGFIYDDPGGGLFLPFLVKNGQDILYRMPESKAKFIKAFSIVHQAYPLIYSNIVPGEMDLNNIPEGVTPVALTNKRTMARIFQDKRIANFRMYEVRGVSHMGGENLVDGKDGDIQILDLSRLMDGVIDLLDDWVEKGIEPPPTKSDEPDLSANNEAIDLPETACPLGRYFPFPSLRGLGGAGRTGFAEYDGTNMEPVRWAVAVCGHERERAPGQARDGDGGVAKARTAETGGDVQSGQVRRLCSEHLREAAARELHHRESRQPVYRGSGKD